ncbi:MaoC family dehydratase [Streptomyces sp. NPDC058374]|uniref:MaoC family dehydratase n=1 Tax=unclassified Streptomyces TaxID=2593676 RepID=UPI0036626C54
MTDIHLATPPALLPLLVKGGATSLLKRASAGAAPPATRLVLSRAEVDPKALRSYAELCGFASGGVPDEQSVLPVTYPHLLGFPLQLRLMTSGDFPFPLMGLVHTSVTITQHRELRGDDRPELVVYVEEFRPHRRGTEAVVVTEARLAGRAVWSSRSTYLARHAGAQAPAAKGGGDEERTVLPVESTWRLPASLGRRYAAVAGDRNPIHLSALTAKPFGFPRAIAHGMWTAARAFAAHGVRGPVRASAAFHAPVLLPSTVLYAAAGPDFELRGPDRPDGTPGRLHVTGRAVPLAPE